MFRAQLVRGQASKCFIDEMARLAIYGAYPEDIKAPCGTGNLGLVFSGL
jgi:hypothetical protein